MRNTGWHRSCLALIVLTLLFSAAPGAQALPAPIAWSTMDQSLGTLAPTSNLLVAEVTGSTCSPMHGRNADTPIAIASVFKLYVLGELTRQVQMGDASWTDQVTLQEALRSMPSGDFAYQPAGTKTTVRALAEAMIWKSDNTATDHLINYLGREEVQRAFAAYGQSDPSLNSPLLLTREMFGIKMTQSPTWIAQYAKASDAEQLAMVRKDIDPLAINPTGGWGAWNGPTAISDVEWFASPNDLCRVMASLWSMSAQPGLEPAREILTGNRGGVTDASAFPHVGYKAGYEAGVVNMTWVLERADGRVFFVTAGYNTPQGTIDQATAHAQLLPVFACLGSQTDPRQCGGNA